MTRNEINVRLAAILSTLKEFGGTAPASPVYLALGCDLASYEKLRGLLVAGGCITATDTTLTLTDRGRELADQIDAAVAHRVAR